MVYVIIVSLTNWRVKFCEFLSFGEIIYMTIFLFSNLNFNKGFKVDRRCVEWTEGLFYENMNWRFLCNLIWSITLIVIALWIIGLWNNYKLNAKRIKEQSNMELSTLRTQVLLRRLMDDARRYKNYGKKN